MGLMFLQHGGILSWGKPTRAVKEILIPIRERAVEVGWKERPHCAPLPYPVITHLPLTLPAWLVWCLCTTPKFNAADTEHSCCLPKAPLGCTAQFRLDILMPGSHCVQKALCYPEPSDISQSMTSLWHLLPHSNECSIL